MYGLVIEGVRFMVEDHYGSATLALVMEQARVSDTTFSTHDRYSEKIVPNMLMALSEITGNSIEDVGILAGRYFLRFMARYAQDLLTVLGRRFSDFLKGLDNLHEYFRLSYERIRPPSFYCDRETTDGLTLHYRSRRRGYVSYVMGQLIEVAKVFYDQDISVEMVRREEKKGFQYVLLRVTFDNRDFNADQLIRERNNALNEFLPIDSLSVLSMFPYFVTFNKHLEILAVGEALNHILPELEKKKLDDEFNLIRPTVKFTWDACIHHLNNLFELHSFRPVVKLDANPTIAVAVNDMVEEKVELPQHDTRDGLGHDQDGNDLGEEEEEDDENAIGDGSQPNAGAVDPSGKRIGRTKKNLAPTGTVLRLKGPMVYLKQSEIIVYLPTVLIDVLDNLFNLGLYMNDYSASDCNREIIMASAQKPDDLKELLKREKEKSRVLAKNMKEIDLAKKTAKELLMQLVPKEIANELLQTGNRSMAISEAYDEVTLAFVKIVDFNALTADTSAMGVVSLLNGVFSILDELVIKHGVYKVETVLESYVISCGVPYPTQNHSEYLADVTLDMIQSMDTVKDTLVEGKKVLIKIGIHAGPVVGGVVGVRAPRFCLFGDTVNTASRLESHNKQPMTIQASVKAKVLLENSAPGQFTFDSRGKVNLKGKGEMLAFGLVSKKGPARYLKIPITQQSGNMHDDDEDNKSVYTTIEDFDDVSRASSMSRMSMSMMGSRTNSQKEDGMEDEDEMGGGGGNSDNDGGGGTPTPQHDSAAPQPPTEPPSYVRKALRTPPSKGVSTSGAGAAASNGNAPTPAELEAEEARLKKKRAKEEQKEKRRQAMAEEKKVYKSNKLGQDL